MNMSTYDYEEQDFDYGPDTGRGRAPLGRRSARAKFSGSRRMNYGRSARPATAYNGIHRRRNKRFAR